jgi:prophage tail gpP-like protein
MGEEIVTVSVGGQSYTGFRRVTVRRKFSDAAGSFHITIAAEDGPYASAWTFKAGAEVSILFNGDLALRAFVDRYQPELSAHKRADIEVSGRSRGQDFIDSSALHKTGEFKNKTVVQIAQELDQFGVGITSDQQLDPVPVYRLAPGETCFRAIEKMCRAQGVWQSGQADGSIKITVAGQGRNGPIIEGQNLKTGKADHNWSNRHSHVVVRGQRPVGHGAQAMEIQATSQDDALTRYRPVLVVQDDDTDQKRAQKRADHRRDSEAGNSLKAHCTMQGFHDDGGALWAPGNLSYLESPFLGISQDMAIDEVDCTQDRHSGSLTKLALVDPRALGAKSARKGGSANAAWNSNAGEADMTSQDSALAGLGGGEGGP